MDPMIAGFLIFGILTAYTALSGEAGGILTQAFQGLIMVAAGVIMIFIFFSMTGGFGNVYDVIASAGTVTATVDGVEVSKSLSSSMLDGWGVLPGSIAMTWMIIPIIGTVGQPSVLTRMYALKDPADMPKLALYGALGHMVVGFFAICMGYAALYLVGTGQVAPLVKGDNAIFVVADHSGLFAQLLVYAAILAASLSTASMFLTLSANIISRDLPSALGLKLEIKKQINLSRAMTVVIGICAILFALTSGEAVAILGTFGWGTLMSASFPVFIIGLLWKGASSKGVFAGLASALVMNVGALLMNQSGFKWPGGMPWYVNVITLAIVITVIVSLATKKDAEEKLEPKVELVIDL